MPEQEENKVSGAIPKEFEDAETKIAEEQEQTPAGDEEELVSSETDEEQELETDESEFEDEPEILEDVSSEVIDCCREFGWDNEKIQKMYQESPELFDAIQEELDAEGDAPAERATSQKTGQEPEKGQKQEQIEGLKLELDEDIVGKDVKDAVDKIVAAVNAQQKGITEQSEKIKADSQAQLDARVDDTFDRISKSFPALGKTDTLTKRQQGLRQEIFLHAATVTAPLRGVSIEKALQLEVNKYRSLGGKKAAEKSVVDKLNKQKKRFTNKPTNRRTSETARKFKDEAEEAEFKMEQAEKKAGLI